MSRLIDADKAIPTLEELTEQVQTEGATLVKALVFAALKSRSVIPTVDAIPIDPLAFWLAGYHVSPPEYALKETGAYCEIDPDGVVYTPNQIATAWAYHLRKLIESGLMGCV